MTINKHEVEHIRKRQLARFLDYLESKNALDDVLESDIKRVFNYVFSDLEELIDRDNDMRKSKEES